MHQGQDGRYERRQLVGDGGMGEVWWAVDTVLRREVALKVPLPRLAQDPIFVERFRREARAMASVKHDNVIDIYDVADTGAGPVIVMEYVAGGSVAGLLQRRGTLTPDETMSIVLQAARALDAAHRQNVVHRDVKPANLLLRPGDGSVVLTDFGIARTATADLLTQPDQQLGTTTYMAPELFRGTGATAQSDIYALGVVAYECLAGKAPFQADSAVAVATMHVMREPEPLPASIPAPVRRIVAKAMAKDPAQRYATAGELISDIEDLSGPVRKRSLRRWLVAALALAVAGTAAGLVVRAYGSSSSGSPSRMPADLSAFAAHWPLDTCVRDDPPGDKQQERWHCPLDESTSTTLYVIRYQPGGVRDEKRGANDRMNTMAGTSGWPAARARHPAARRATTGSTR